MRNNNILLKNASSTQPPVAVTTDGTTKRDTNGTFIVNGVQNWVYEEEVFSSMSAMWWAPDGKHLTYLSSDETKVPDYLMPVYDDVYPTIVTIAYPKVTLFFFAVVVSACLYPYFFLFRRDIPTLWCRF